MNKDILRLSGIEYGQLSITRWDTVISIHVYNPTGNAIIGLDTDKIIQLIDFLNDIVGTKKKDDSK